MTESETNLMNFVAAMEGLKPSKPETKVCAHCGMEKPIGSFYKKGEFGGTQSWCKKCQKEHGRLRNGSTGEYRTPDNESSDNQVSPSNNNDKMEDFTFYDFEKKPAVSDRTIGKGHAALNYNKKNMCLSFGVHESTDIIKAKLMKVRVRVDNITGDMHLVFNRDQGAQATIKNQKNISILNKDLVEFLMTTQCLPLNEGSRHIIDISGNLSNSPDYITYKIIRKKK